MLRYRNQPVVAGLIFRRGQPLGGFCHVRFPCVFHLLLRIFPTQKCFLLCKPPDISGFHIGPLCIHIFQYIAHTAAFQHTGCPRILIHGFPNGSGIFFCNGIVSGNHHGTHRGLGIRKRRIFGWVYQRSGKREIPLFMLCHIGFCFFSQDQLFCPQSNPRPVQIYVTPSPSSLENVTQTALFQYTRCHRRGTFGLINPHLAGMQWHKSCPR